MSKLPTNGLDDYESAVKDGFKFIDKTTYIENITKYSVVLMCRPRRFGKSLFTSMLKSYFEGKKELFVNTSIYDIMPTEEYPVIYFNFSKGSKKSSNSLKTMLKSLVQTEANRHSIKLKKTLEIEQLLEDLVVKLTKKNDDKKVVLLIDEYDHPLQEFLTNESRNSKRALDTRLEHYMSFFATVKALSPHLKFVYITGISRIAKASVFSGLNNATDLSMMTSMSGLFGVTFDELKLAYPKHIEAAQTALNMNDQQISLRLNETYGGYSFKDTTIVVMNTLCVLKFLDPLFEFKLKDHWVETGPSRLFLKIFKFQDVFKNEIVVEESDLQQSTPDLGNLDCFLYDVGLITIKKEINSKLTLGFPNAYVKKYVIKNVYNWIFKTDNLGQGDTTMMDLLFADDFGGFRESFRNKIVNIPFQQWCAKDLPKLYLKECVFQLMFNFYLQSTEYYRSAELCNLFGRSDNISENGSQIMIFEFKVNGSTSEALEQCFAKNYSSHFQTSSKAVYYVGINIVVDKGNKDHHVVEIQVEKNLCKAAHKRIKK